jgi:1,4-dihydroxy-2-naphthoate octaprenyltransferase
MAMVGSVGAGTLAFILLFCILIVLLILVIATNMRIIRVAFWVYLPILILLLIIMANIPYEPKEPVTERNSHLKIIASFGAFIFLGLVVSVIFYLIVVLLRQDLALAIPSSS